MSILDLPADVIRLICTFDLEYFDYLNLNRVNRRLHEVIENSWSFCAQQYLTSESLSDPKVALRECYSDPQYLIAVRHGYEIFIGEHYTKIKALSLADKRKLTKAALISGRLPIYKLFEHITIRRTEYIFTLKYAVLSNNLELVKYIIPNRPLIYNLKWVIEAFFNAYQIIPYNRLRSKDWNFEIVELLLFHGGTLLDEMTAALLFTVKHVRYLLTKGFSIPPYAISMILESSYYADKTEIFGIIRYLVEECGQSARSADQINPEFYDIPGLIKYLIEHGLSISTQRKVLWYCVYKGQSDIIDIILSSGFDITPDIVREMLIATNSTGNIALLETLVKHNADLSVLSDDLIRDSRWEIREFLNFVILN